MKDETELHKLRFYRDEVKHEFNLLAMRSTILITCQSFLIVPFAILNTALDFRLVCGPIFFIAALGVFVAHTLKIPIETAHKTIDDWLLKQRKFFKQRKEMLDFASPRDLIEGADEDIGKDKDHIESLAFTNRGPNAFIIFWILATAWTILRTYIAFKYPLTG